MNMLSVNTDWYAEKLIHNQKLFRKYRVVWSLAKKCSSSLGCSKNWWGSYSRTSWRKNSFDSIVHEWPRWRPSPYLWVPSSRYSNHGYCGPTFVLLFQTERTSWNRFTWADLGQVYRYDDPWLALLLLLAQTHCSYDYEEYHTV